jgi:predicted ATPase
MDIELRHLNILIGANGAGKSNLVSFFRSATISGVSTTESPLRVP